MTVFQKSTTASIRIPKKQPPPRRLRWLVASICIIEFCYLLLILCSSLPALPLSGTPLVAIWPQILTPAQFPLSAIEPLIIQHLWLSPLCLGLVFIGLTGTYIFALRCALRMPEQDRNTRRGLYIVIGGALLFGITLLFQPRIFSDDVFNSIFSGRILAIYGADPLNSAPIQFKVFDDPYLTWVITGRTSHNIYGPLWLYIVTLLAGVSSNPLISLFLFKGVSLLTHLIDCLLIWTILGKIAPTRRLSGTLIYAWSPLALIELAGSGHNEGLLIGLLLLATLLYVIQIEQSRHLKEASKIGQAKHHYVSLRSPWFLRICVLLVLSLASSINIISLLIALLYIWFELRRENNGMRVFIGLCWRLCVILIPALLILLPFWRGSDTFFDLTSSVDMSHFVYSPIGILVTPLRVSFLYFAGKNIPGFLQPAATADMAVRASAAFIFVLIYTNLFGKIRNDYHQEQREKNSPSAQQAFAIPGLDTLLSCCTIAIFSYLALVSGSFWPWYTLWMLWIVALRSFDAFASTVLVLSSTALFIYAFVGFSTTPLETYQSAVIFGIPLVYLLIVKKKQKQQERTTHLEVR